MKAVIIDGPGSLRIVDKPLPVPGRGEALVKIKYCGICGSDLHAFETGFLPPDLTIGHEFSGIVESVGTGCPGWEEGVFVTGNNIIGCGKCSFCQKGLENLCLDMRRLGITDHGAMAEYALVPVKALVKLPQSASLTEAALSEPLSVGLHAVNKVNITADDSILIIGAGTIGLVILALLQLRAAKAITVVEPDPDRRAIAKSMGALKVIDPFTGSMDSEISRLTGNRGMNVIFECAGLPETIQEACSQAAADATIMVLSICHQPVELNFLSLVTREIKIKTAFGKTSAEFREAANLISSGMIDLSPLVTGLIPLDKVLQTFRKHSGGMIKTLVLF
ncbi:MAG: alcohol dehydrogenase catalytic domain-containing protein [Firmicutes bacterium]|nr:alcohol dehydrogenase catalytic domain-containing protein [Bacillota bacterium]